MRKNFVRAEYEPGKYITDFRVGAKWSNVIRYRWKDFCNYMTYAPGIQYTLALDKVPVISSGLRGTTTTVYPDPDPETTTVDGHVGDSSSSSWDTTHDAAGNDSNSTLTVTRIEAGKDVGGNFRIRRGVHLFDTSAIDSGDTISSATMSLYGQSILNDDNDGDDFLAIVTSNPASNTDLVDGDYDAVGDAVDNPTEMHDAGARIDFGSISTVAYNDFAFNATGISNVTKGGITKLGAREGHDIIDSAFTGSNGDRNRANMYSADQTGTTNDPKLVVEHAAGGASFTPKSIFI